MTMKQGDMVYAGGWPAVVVSAPKGPRVMCTVFGFCKETADVWIKDVRPCTRDQALGGLGFGHTTEGFDTTVAKNVAEYNKKQAAKARAALRKAS